MRREKIDDETLAILVGDCTSHAVKKWKYGERQPPGEKIVRIEEVTRGDVTLRDLVNATTEAPAPAEIRS